LRTNRELNLVGLIFKETRKKQEQLGR